MMTFDGKDIYPTIASKAGALAHALILNHPFLDGDKRIGHAAMEMFLVTNGREIDASVDEQEKLILAVASGQITISELTDWIEDHLFPYGAIRRPNIHLRITVKIFLIKISL
jgi:death-on-curing protein